MLPVLFYGRPRESWNIDVVLLTRLSEDELAELFDAARYEPVLKEINVVKFKDKKTNSYVDVILNPEAVGLTLNSFKRKKVFRINDFNVNVPCAEDYIITKLKARRALTEDYRDLITTLTKMFEGLNWKYLEKRAKALNLLHLLKYYKEGLERRVM